MFKISKTTIALSALGCAGTGISAALVYSWSSMLSWLGILPSATYQKYFLILKLQPQGCQELTLCLSLLSLIALFVTVLGFAQHWGRGTDSPRTGSLWAHWLKLGLPLGAVTLFAAVDVFVLARTSSRWSCSPLPDWAQNLYAIVGVSLFAPIVIAAWRSRTGFKLSPDGWRRMAAIAIFGAPAWMAGGSLSCEVWTRTYLEAARQLNMSREFRSDEHLVKDERSLAATYVTLHAAMPAVICAPGSLSGQNQGEITCKERLLAWDKETVVNDLTLCPSSFDAQTIIAAAADQSPSPALRKALEKLSDAQQFQVKSDFTAALLAKACRRNGLSTQAERLDKIGPAKLQSALPSSSLHGRLLIDGQPVSSSRIRLVRVRESDFQTYTEMAGSVRFGRENRCGSAYNLGAFFYEVTSPSEGGDFYFAQLDKGRYLLQVRLEGTPQVSSFTQIPVVSVGDNQRLEVGDLNIQLR